ncbi:VOC family protein [Mycobacterium hodleri]|uniref:VOC family protein n=1 Tax=Mycolicibacterium hodleri TaxID=49897 RepID=A0A544VQZ2_9MYCO|nr:VOC family protein [Mycolicibacterium hodleri]TQR82397.1 VOC family protein [Mycolicibacterium hodleri]
MHNERLAVDHVGLTVPDLDQAVTFFTEAFGCEEIFRAGPYSDCGYFWPGEAQPEVATVRLAMLRHGGTHNVELLEYKDRSRVDRPEAPRPTERGGAHLAFYVDDIHALVDALRQRNDVRFLGVVEREQGGPIDGLEWVYLLTSWGLVIELLRWEPGQLPYEVGTSARLIPPPWLRDTATG